MTRHDRLESMRVVGYHDSLVPLFRQDHVAHVYLVYLTLWPMIADVTFAAYCADDVEGPLRMDQDYRDDVMRHQDFSATVVGNEDGPLTLCSDVVETAIDAVQGIEDNAEEVM